MKLKKPSAKSFTYDLLLFKEIEKELKNAKSQNYQKSNISRLAKDKIKISKKLE